MQHIVAGAYTGRNRAHRWRALEPEGRGGPAELARPHVSTRSTPDRPERRELAGGKEQPGGLEYYWAPRVRDEHELAGGKEQPGGLEYYWAPRVRDEHELAGGKEQPGGLEYYYAPRVRDEHEQLLRWIDHVEACAAPLARKPQPVVLCLFAPLCYVMLPRNRRPWRRLTRVVAATTRAQRLCACRAMRAMRAMRASERAAAARRSRA
jgi:hypothetical protein